MRLIDADAFADRLLNAWDTADEQKRSDIVAIMADIVVPILAGTPTVDIKTEVAKEIFAEIDKLHIHVTNEFDAMNYEKLKNKYTKEGVGE